MKVVGPGWQCHGTAPPTGIVAFSSRTVVGPFLNLVSARTLAVPWAMNSKIGPGPAWASDLPRNITRPADTYTATIRTTAAIFHLECIVHLLPNLSIYLVPDRRPRPAYASGEPRVLHPSGEALPPRRGSSSLLARCSSKAAIPSRTAKTIRFPPVHTTTHTTRPTSVTAFVSAAEWTRRVLPRS